MTGGAPEPAGPSARLAPASAPRPDPRTELARACAELIATTPADRAPLTPAEAAKRRAIQAVIAELD